MYNPFIHYHFLSEMSQLIHTKDEIKKIDHIFIFKNSIVFVKISHRQFFLCFLFSQYKNKLVYCMFFSHEECG